MKQDSSNLTGKAIYSARWTGLSAVHSVASQAIKVIVLGRLLAPEAFGLMALAYLVIEYSMIFVRGGLTEAIIYRQDATRDQLSSLYWINFFFGLLLTVAVIASAEPLGRLLGNVEVTPILKVIGVSLTISAVSVQFLTQLRKQLLFKTLSTIEIIHKSVDVVVAVVLAVLGYGVWALVWGAVVSMTVKTMLLFAVAVRHQFLPSLHFRFNDVKSYLSFGAFRIGTDLLNRLYTKGDQMIIAAAFDVTTLGYYHMASRLIFIPVQQINPIITKVSFPALARVQHEQERLRRGYLRIVRLLQFVIVPILTIFAFTAHLVIPFVLGEQWLPIVPLVQIMAFYGILRSTMNVTGSLNMAKGKANWTFYFNIVLALVVLGAMGTSVLLFGTVHALALTITVTFTFLWLFHYRFFVHRLAGPSGKQYFGSIGRALVCSGFAGVVSWLIGHVIGPPLVMQTVAALVVGGLAYIGASYVVQRGSMRELMGLIGK